MKNIITILAASVLVLFFSSQISASGYSGKTEAGGVAGSTAEAIKHAEMAKTHGDDAKKILQHGEMSLKYMEEVDRETVGKVNVEEDKHINGAVMHLKEAISHAEMGHADVANKHISEALNDMRQIPVK